VAPAVVLGVGLGGLLDGIVFHQLLQWHHLVSRTHSPETVAGLEINTLADGLFHLVMLVVLGVGLVLTWRQARRGRLDVTPRRIVGAVLTGLGGFNVVEGGLMHLLLGLHHVNETVPRAQWFAWDLGFLLLSSAVAATGLTMMRSGSTSRTQDVA